MKIHICGLAVLALLAAAAFHSCSSDNTGSPCEFTQGKPYCKTNVAEKNVASDCNDHWCLSYNGSRPFCSKECTYSDSCPGGYRCLKQDFSPLDPTLKGIYFCIPKSSGSCGNDDDCNPCAGKPDCVLDYFCQGGYCQPNSCKQQADGGM
jgi:hypothetical protein